MARRNYVKIRSFLISNVDVLLDNVSQRRNDKKINSDELFAAGSSTSKLAHLQTEFPEQSKLDILLQEKESLGLYVSGNPLEEYRTVDTWLKEVSYNDGVHIVVINKIRKIFTKKGHMMFALELSSPVEDYEGIIFPKSAMELSPRLKEKDIFLVKGKLDQQQQTNTKVTEEGDVQEYDQQAKILIDNIVPFEQGLPKLLIKDEATLSSLTFQRAMTGINWSQLKENPHALTGDLGAKQPQSTSSTYREVKEKVIKLTKNLGISRIKEIKKQLQHSPAPGFTQVKIEIESGGEFKKVKGNFWLDDTVVEELAQ